jgi:uncharacterized protein YjiS (DUF1127 family)
MTCQSSTVLSTQFRRWRECRRYRTTVRELRALAPQDLEALGIPVGQIDRLAREAARSYAGL